MEKEDITSKSAWLSMWIEDLQSLIRENKAKEAVDLYLLCDSPPLHRLSLDEIEKLSRWLSCA